MTILSAVPGAGLAAVEAVAAAAVEATIGSSSPTNKAPVFTAGASATRSVAENTAAGVNIGAPVTATDGDRDTLTYTVGGDDGSAFAVNSTTGTTEDQVGLRLRDQVELQGYHGRFRPQWGQ